MLCTTRRCSSSVSSGNLGSATASLAALHRRQNFRPDLLILPFQGEHLYESSGSRR